MLYRYILSIILTFFSVHVVGIQSSFAASIQSFEYQAETGQISRLAVVHKNKLLILDDEGKLQQIYWFAEEKKALSFSFAKPRDPQLEKISLSCHGAKENKTILYGKNISDVSVLTYYRRSYDKTNGCFNAVATVQDLALDYYKDTPNNRKADIVGRLKQFGDITIQYHRGTSKAYRGKIKTINTLHFMYESWSRYGENAGYVGKYSRIGDVSFRYLEATSVNEKNQAVGQILKIGKLKFTYFSTFSIPHPPPEMMGYFQSLEGTDERFSVSIRQQ